MENAIPPVVSDVTEILSHESLYHADNVKDLLKLEDQVNSNSCVDSKQMMKTHESCLGLARSLLPKNYAKNGWKALLEIKQQTIEPKSARTSYQADFAAYDFSNYYDSKSSIAAKGPLSSEELDREVENIQNFYRPGSKSASDGGLDPFDIRTKVILDQIGMPGFVDENMSREDKDAKMFNHIKSYTKDLSDKDYLRFISASAGWVDYNDARAALIQKSGAALGVVTSFEQLSKTGSGICGDIHSMAARLGELRGWEAFTVQYSPKGGNHVVTALVDPKNPNNLKIVNYGTYEEQNLTNGQWVNPTPTTSMQSVGMQMRIFKNDKPGQGNGKMQQIATLPTAMGSLMNQLFVKQEHIAKAMPQNQNYTIRKIGSDFERNKVLVKKEGTKVIDRTISDGILIYEGETDNDRVVGVALNDSTYKNIYYWDEKQQKCVLKKNTYFSIGLAANIVNQRHTGIDKSLFFYLDIKGGRIQHLYQNKNFQVKGLIGYELEAMTALDKIEGRVSDYNLTTFLGVVTDFNKDGTKIHTGMTVEMNVGFKDETRITDFKNMHKNINPANFNAVSLDANLSQKIDSKNTFLTNNNLTMTRVGGRVLLSAGVAHNNTTIMASYQGGVKPLNTGNHLQNVNLLQNFNNMDGFKLSVGQNFTNRNRNIAGSISGYAGVSTSTYKPLPMVGATLKMTIGGLKKKR